MSASPEFHHDQPITTGVLITNLGTPDAPTPEALRRYLAEFLWDPRIVDSLPRPIWWLALHGLILRIRPPRSAKAYASIWGDEGSPLLAIAERQLAALRESLAQRLPGPVVVELGMRYGNPSLASAVAKLRDAGARRVLVLPLYPQYSCSTTASTFDAIAEEMKSWRWVPELRFINQYHDETGYIEALASSIRESWAKREPPEKLLFSFHGTPRRFFTEGDPYHCQCHKTARLVAERLGLAENRWQLTFQSIFGREEWLQPYTIETLRELGDKGVKSVDIVCPGFSADCLETLEEIAVENKAAYLEAGGEKFHYIPALNDRADHITALAGLVQKHLAGWPEAEPDWNAAQEDAGQVERLARARAAGAKD
ncbi:MAG TPA: ferrochelatase [Gammaproteobacteria bacterium]|nr:ferrochelatase [Gammaproteobacteria bacterium]